jgi:hypothetical protein
VDLVELRERANGIGNLPARESTEDIVSKLAELCLPGALVDHDATHMDVARTAKAQFLRARADTPDDLRDRNRLVVELADCLEQALVILELMQSLRASWQRRRHGRVPGLNRHSLGKWL